MTKEQLINKMDNLSTQMKNVAFDMINFKNSDEHMHLSAKELNDSGLILKECIEEIVKEDKYNELW